MVGHASHPHIRASAFGPCDLISASSRHVAWNINETPRRVMDDAVNMTLVLIVQELKSRLARCRA
jgi:hypothetical protein